jgi:catechol 2,3-dioxygenase-like lactoylglutathione lyase family enzyme
MFLGINHICVVTRDVDRAVRIWADKYGVGPWTVREYPQASIDVKLGETPTRFGMRVGLASINATTRIEIIQPTDELSPYAASLTERGNVDHFHHVRFDVADHETSLDRLRAAGLASVMSGVIQSANPEAPCYVDYVDTEADLGLLIEFATLPEGYRLPDPEYVYPEEAGRGAQRGRA